MPPCSYIPDGSPKISITHKGESSRWPLLLVHIILLCAALTLIARLALRLLVVPYLAALFVQQSNWSVRELHIGQQVQCIYSTYDDACYECHLSFEVSNAPFATKIGLVLPSVHLRDLTENWFLGTMIIPPLEISDDCTESCVIDTKVELMTGRPIDQAVLSHLRSASNITFFAATDFTVYGLPISNVVLNQTQPFNSSSVSAIVV